MSDPSIYLITRIVPLEVNGHSVKAMCVLRIKVWGDWPADQAVLTGSLDEKGRPVMDLAPMPHQHEILAHEMRALEDISTPPTETVVMDQTTRDTPIDPALLAEFGMPEQPKLVPDRERSTRDKLMGGSDLGGVERLVH